MLQILAHSDLPHEFVLVTIHAGQLSDVGKDVLQAIGKLESVDVVQSILYVRVDNQLSETKDFTTQMESLKNQEKSGG